MPDKKYTPAEAAMAVLKKATELYNASPLAKSEDFKKGEWNKIHDKLESEGYSKESADKIDGSIKAKVDAKKLKKDEDMGSDMSMDMSEKNPDEKADAKLGEHVEREVESHEEENEDPKHEMKGHIKLAKFMGRMEHKKGMKSKEMDKAETGFEQGVHTSRATGLSPSKTAQGRSDAGMHAMASKKDKDWANSGQASSPKTSMAISKDHKNAAVSEHKQVLDQIHNMTKPKLPG